MVCRRAARAGVGVCVICALASISPAQPAAPRDVARASLPPAVVRGRVVADATGDPLRNARVALEGAGTPVPVLTDDDGRFVLPGAGTAESVLAASKAGYARTMAKVAADLEIRLPRAGAIAGRVVDDFGAPLPLVSVVAERVVRGNGDVTFAAQSRAETDDTGAYRLFGLPAGEFVVAVAGGRTMNGSNTTPLPQVFTGPLHNYYPHAQRREDAAAIAVRAGEEIAGIDLTMAAPAGLPPRPPPRLRRERTATIEGRIVRSDGLAVRFARVQLSSGEQSLAPFVAEAIADEDGRYEFVDVAPGRYLVAASDTSLTSAAFGQRRPGDRGELITVRAGTAVDHIDIAMPRRSAISGRILDEYGDPIANANVRVEQIRWRQGRFRLVRVRGIAGRQTDDLGRFRIFGLEPGRHVVGAMVGEVVAGWETADLPGYVPSFFPGTPAAAEAQTVDVASGQDVLNIDFALQRGAAGRIRGRAVTGAGVPFTGIVNLSPSYRSRVVVSGSFPVGARSNGGNFEFDRLTPGEYVVQAATSRLDPATEGEFGAQFVAVNGTVADDVVVQMSAGSTIACRVTFDGPPPAAPEGFAFSAEPADPDFRSLADNPVARGEPREDWTFEMRGLNGPRLVRLASAPPGWALKAVRVNGLDVTDAPLPFGTREQSLDDVEIVLTDRAAEIAGVVETDRHGMADDAAVVAFASDRTRWHRHSRFVAHADADRSRAFTLRGIGPGEYYVAAIDRRDGIDLDDRTDDAEFLESLITGAVRVTVAEGERTAVTVRLSAR